MATVSEVSTEITKLSDAERSQVILDVISSSTVLWLADFTDKLKEKFGVTAMAPVMGAIPAASPAAEEEPEKVSFDVVLESAGANKIQVIKAVRAVTNLGLKEAKAVVDTAPQNIKEAVTKEEAEKIVKELEAAGAQVKIK